MSMPVRRYLATVQVKVEIWTDGEKTIKQIISDDIGVRLEMNKPNPYVAIAKQLPAIKVVNVETLKIPKRIKNKSK